MNCPNCGTPVLAEHGFCRSCGKALTEAAPSGSRPQIWGIAFLALMFGGIMLALAGKMFDMQWLTFTGVFICLGGMFSMAAFAMLPQTRPKKRKPRQVPEPAPLTRADTTNKLLPLGENDFIPSVTESTTNLLKTPNTKARTK